jgi:dihydrofolate reductase
VAKLIYTTLMSLDGYIADETGNFDWAAPDEEVHRFVNDLERDVGTYLYGRRMYETMRYWQTGGDDDDITRDFAGIWRAADKIVFSRTLDRVDTPRTKLERELTPEAVRRLKDSADRDLGIGGAELAGQALAAGLVDELHLFVVPHLAGGGTPALAGGTATSLKLREDRRFRNGTVFLRYEVTPDRPLE